MSRVDLAVVRETVAHNPNVVAAWAFGSAREGEVRHGGDFDIAVFFAHPPALDELCDGRADLQQALGIDEVDFVPLNDASPVLRFEAVSGRRLFCRDEEACAAFVSLTAREYEDEIALTERGLAYWKEAAGRQSFHGAP
jgi:predicted nucleotidyltransferase